VSATSNARIGGDFHGLGTIAAHHRCRWILNAGPGGTVAFWQDIDDVCRLISPGGKWTTADQSVSSKGVLAHRSITGVGREIGTLLLEFRRTRIWGAKVSAAVISGSDNSVINVVTAG
jgi:hypothetical protein